jgi:hypothetical protein
MPASPATRRADALKSGLDEALVEVLKSLVEKYGHEVLARTLNIMRMVEILDAVVPHEDDEKESPQ